MSKPDGIFFGRFEDGKLKLKDKAKMDLLASLLDRKDIRFEIKEAKMTRSNKQNGW